MPARKPAPKQPIRPITRADLRKAKPDESWVACYDASGSLVGICPPDAITPVTGADAPSKALPKPKPAASAEAAAGETPEMGVQKARAAAAQLKKQLYTSATTEEQNKIATAMNVAAADVLKQIQARPRRRG